MSIRVATVNGRRDKNDVILEELMATGNWKQALILVEKRLKKNDKSIELIVNKISILLASCETDRQAQAIAEVRELLGRKPPISDFDILVAIETLAEKWPGWYRESKDVINQMWERAAVAKPKDEKLFDLWFKTKFASQNYKAAQKAAMLYSKNFPKDRRPYYRLILSSHLASESPELPDSERSMFKEMAYRLLTKALSSIPDDNMSSQLGNLSLESGKSNVNQGLVDASRALKNPGDLLFLLRIYQSQGRDKEALDILNNPRTGLTSSIGHSSWELVLAKVALNESCGLWEAQWRDCEDLLRGARPSYQKDPEYSGSVKVGTFGNDWTIWAAFLKASSKLASMDISTRTKEMIDSYLANGKKSLNAQKAMVEFYAADPVRTGNDCGNLLSALLAFYYEYSASPVCFDGLRHAQRLALDQKREFLIMIEKHTNPDKIRKFSGEKERRDWVLSEINYQKQAYTLVISVQAGLDNTKLLESFVAVCLHLYKISLPLSGDLPVSERQPGDDAAILAAMGCIHLFNNGDERGLIRAAAILELLLSYSAHNYDAQLIIIRVYIYLGLGAQAMSHYARLDIKHLQYLTNSWILFTRISTIHPHPFPVISNNKIEQTSPATMLKYALSWGYRQNRQVEQGIASFFEHDSLYELLQHLEFQKTTEVAALVKASLMVEAKRITRLGHGFYGLDYNVVIGDPSRFVFDDVRNTTSFPSYEAHGQASFEHYLRPGPMTEKAWLLAQLRLNDLVHAIMGVDTDQSHLFRLPDTGDMTLPEKAAAEWTTVMTSLQGGAMQCSKSIQKEFSSCLEGALSRLDHFINPWTTLAKELDEDPTQAMVSLSPDLAVPNWYTFHRIFMVMDQCAITTAFLQGLATLNRKSHYYEDQSALDTTAASMKETGLLIFRAINRAAKGMQAKLMQTTKKLYLQEVCFGKEGDESDVVGMEMRTLVESEQWITDYCKGMMGGWSESLQGVISTKYRTVKQPPTSGT
ncbi:hypothetical protein MMC26_006536 [Xylographa opegraphella]|nr:hypothetical protein [Xylographa opegraphella]